MKINFSEIRNKSKELECYKGYLPSIVQQYIDYENYISFLQKEGLFEDLVIQLSKSRHFSREKREKEFKEWVDENPQYKNFIE